MSLLQILYNHNMLNYGIIYNQYYTYMYEERQREKAVLTG